MIDIDSLARSPWVAGALGAVVSLKSIPGVTWFERIFNVLCGALIAGYASPAVAEFYSLHSPQMLGATAFGCGIFGLNLVSAIVETIRTNNLTSFLPWRK